jgi:hypothetical protein
MLKKYYDYFMLKVSTNKIAIVTIPIRVTIGRTIFNNLAKAKLSIKSFINDEFMFSFFEEIKNLTPDLKNNLFDRRKLEFDANYNYIIKHVSKGEHEYIKILEKEIESSTKIKYNVNVNVELEYKITLLILQFTVLLHIKDYTNNDNNDNLNELFFYITKNVKFLTKILKESKLSKILGNS